MKRGFLKYILISTNIIFSICILIFIYFILTQKEIQNPHPEVLASGYLGDVRYENISYNSNITFTLDGNVETEEGSISIQGNKLQIADQAEDSECTDNSSLCKSYINCLFNEENSQGLCNYRLVYTEDTEESLKNAL